MVKNTKVCSVCNEVKPLEQFYRRKEMSDGHKSECMICSRKASNKWKVENKAAYRSSRENSYLKRSEEDRIKWKKTNPLGYLCSTAKSNSKRYGREHSINTAFLKELWLKQKGLCYYTGRPMLYGIGQDSAVSIDRLDSNEGYTESNVVLCQYRINVVKNNVSVKELIEISKDILKTLNG